jgi:flagellar biosynthesis anti-sigma factor FlgM
MRIDSNQGPQPLNESSAASSQNAVGASNSSSDAIGPSYALGEDQAQLSGAHTQVDALAAQAAQLPEIREERVLALRQAVESGQYSPSSEQVAGAVVDSMISAYAA